MVSCECGSADFVVEYQTTARLRLVNGIAQAVSYGPVNEGLMVSTVTCTGCSARLDIDNSLTGADPDACLFSFVATRYRADTVASDLPAVTVRTRTSPIEPVARPRGPLDAAGPRYGEDRCPPGPPTIQTVRDLVNRPSHRDD